MIIEDLSTGQSWGEHVMNPSRETIPPPRLPYAKPPAHDRPALRPKFGLNVKNPPKIRLKNSWNWRTVLIPATILQLFSVKLIRGKWKYMSIWWNLLRKTREITLMELILRQIIAIWNHCAQQQRNFWSLMMAFCVQ